MVKRPIHRYENAQFIPEYDELAEESIIEIVNQNETIVRLLATPLDLEDLALGHIFSEGRGDVESVSTNGTTVTVIGNVIPRPTNDILTASCGACSTGEVEIPNGIVTNNASIVSDFKSIMENMRSKQLIFQRTGGVHASAILDKKGKILHIREDIGRHNAMDKAIGACLRESESPKIIALSSRIGWELVAKAVRANVEIIIAAGAISASAERLARSSNITLIGFANQDKPMIIGSTNRIVDKED